MPEQISTHRAEGADVEVLSSLYPVPGLGFVPINAFLLRAKQPVLVDTGAVSLREPFFDAICAAIDLDDLRWIYLTHTDPDHIGCLLEVLEAAPRARLVTTFLGLGKLGLLAPISPERVMLLNPGQSLFVGDRDLVALKPPTYDAPETTGFFDSRTGALFSADCFGAVLSGPAEHAGDLPASALRDGMVTWATVDAPWLASVSAAVLDEALQRVRELAPPIVLSSHLPPAFDACDTLLEHLAEARTAPPFEGPDQRAMEALMASASATTPPEQRSWG